MAMTKAEERAAVVSNTDLVHAIAAEFRAHGRTRGVDLEDLVQEGTMGLLRAIRDWDPNRATLRTYARFWIRDAIQKAVGYDGYKYVERPTTSLDAVADNGSCLHDVLPSETFENPEEAAIRNERIQTVRDAVASLEGRDAAIFRGSLYGSTNEDIGQEIGISRERVRQIKGALFESAKRRAAGLS